MTTRYTNIILLSLVTGALIVLSGFEITRPSLAAIQSANLKKSSSSNNRAFGRYGPGFYNHSGCLYVHIGDNGLFEMTTADDFKVNETLELSSLDFEEQKSRCREETKSGKLTFTYKFPKNERIGSIMISMRILPTDNGGYWEVSQANLTVTRADIERKRTFPMRLSNMYAGRDYSYSCSQLVMTTLPRRQKSDNDTKVDPYASVTLPRFQLQPFEQMKDYVFAPSYDCSVWMTIPGLMGFILILFMTIVTIIGVSLLKSIETNDFKFQKEGLQFTQAQMELSKQNR